MLLFSFGIECISFKLLLLRAYTVHNYIQTHLVSNFLYFFSFLSVIQVWVRDVRAKLRRYIQFINLIIFLGYLITKLRSHLWIIVQIICSPNSIIIIESLNRAFLQKFLNTSCFFFFFFFLWLVVTWYETTSCFDFESHVKN